MNMLNTFYKYYLNSFRDEVDVLSMLLCSPSSLALLIVGVVVVFHFFVDAVVFIGQSVGADPVNDR